MEFVLCFNDLYYANLEFIINLAERSQEELTISEVKNINSIFTDKNKPELELLEFSAKGIEYLISINERNFMPW